MEITADVDSAFDCVGDGCEVLCDFEDAPAVVVAGESVFGDEDGLVFQALKPVEQTFGVEFLKIEIHVDHLLMRCGVPDGVGSFFACGDEVAAVVVDRPVVERILDFGNVFSVHVRQDDFAGADGVEEEFVDFPVVEFGKDAVEFIERVCREVGAERVGGTDGRIAHGFDDVIAAGMGDEVVCAVYPVVLVETSARNIEFVDDHPVVDVFVDCLDDAGYVAFEESEIFAVEHAAAFLEPLR